MKTHLINLCKMVLNKAVLRGNPHTPFLHQVLRARTGTRQRPQKTPVGGDVGVQMVISCLWGPGENPLLPRSFLHTKQSHRPLVQGRQLRPSTNPASKMQHQAEAGCYNTKELWEHYH